MGGAQETAERGDARVVVLGPLASSPGRRRIVRNFRISNVIAVPADARLAVEERAAVPDQVSHHDERRDHGEHDESQQRERDVDEPLHPAVRGARGSRRCRRAATCVRAPRSAASRATARRTSTASGCGVRLRGAPSPAATTSELSCAPRTQHHDGGASGPGEIEQRLDAVGSSPTRLRPAVAHRRRLQPRSGSSASSSSRQAYSSGSATRTTRSRSVARTRSSARHDATQHVPGHEDEGAPQDDEPRQHGVPGEELHDRHDQRRQSRRRGRGQERPPERPGLLRHTAGVRGEAEQADVPQRPREPARTRTTSRRTRPRGAAHPDDDDRGAEEEGQAPGATHPLVIGVSLPQAEPEPLRQPMSLRVRNTGIRRTSTVCGAPGTGRWGAGPTRCRHRPPPGRQGGGPRRAIDPVARCRERGRPDRDDHDRADHEVTLLHPPEEHAHRREQEEGRHVRVAGRPTGDPRGCV